MVSRLAQAGARVRKEGGDVKDRCRQFSSGGRGNGTAARWRRSKEAFFTRRPPSYLGNDVLIEQQRGETGRKRERERYEEGVKKESVEERKRGRERKRERHFRC